MKTSPAQTYHSIYKNIDFDTLSQKLKAKHLQAKSDFMNNFSEANSYLTERGKDLEKIRQNSAKIIGAGALTGSLLLTNPATAHALPSVSELVNNLNLDDLLDKKQDTSLILKETLNKYLPERARPLSSSEEKFLEILFKNTLGISTKATLEGEHLNTSYGYIGAEQHLKRYPGDNILQHDKETQVSGMAPGLGAWGFFAASKNDLTESLKETEKWYAVVQTLYLPDWNTRFPYLREWYKYRKVLIVDAESGKAVVAAIADSGPAAWTGKHFGGSPEVMNALGGKKYKKGKVVLFFVDDPDNKVKLGPIDASVKDTKVDSLTMLQ